jgi:hypothetical protein
MPDDAGFQAMLDEHEISRVVADWGFARDGGDWEALKACFHPDATVEIMWITGLAHDFADSLKNRPPLKPGEHIKHQVGAPQVHLNGGRAVSECHLILFSRIFIDDFAFDFTAWGRFFDLFEKRGGEWRISKRTAIYEKDRMDPVQPEKIPASFYDSVQLEGYPPECRYMCYRHEKHGRKMASKIMTAYSAEERALREEGERWLAGE